MSAGAPPQDEWTTLERRLTDWIESNDNVRAAAISGSRARSDRPADKWSDLDLLIFVRDRTSLFESTQWLDEVSPRWAIVDHVAPIADLKVRQVLFEGALDVDILPMPAGEFSELLADAGVADLVAKGFRILVDKDGELASVTIPVVASDPGGPTREAFEWTVNDFFFQTVWATKHLCRGELWMAKDDVDGYMKRDLLAVIEWHAVATGRNVATWAGGASGGRLLERWADPAILEDLPATFAAYDKKDVARALLAMIDLFDRVAGEVGASSGYEYAADRFRSVSDWVAATLEAADL